jgi:hypothetical protein
MKGLIEHVESAEVISNTLGQWSELFAIYCGKELPNDYMDRLFDRFIDKGNLVEKTTHNKTTCDAPDLPDVTHVHYVCFYLMGDEPTYIQHNKTHEFKY